MENNEYKKIWIKNCTCCYFGDILKSSDFDLDNILSAKSHTKTFWFITFHIKL